MQRQCKLKDCLGLHYFFAEIQSLVILSDYFDITLDELVKDIDVQDVRNKNLTDEKISSIHADLEKGKYYFNQIITGLSVLGWTVIVIIVIVILAKLF